MVRGCKRTDALEVLSMPVRDLADWLTAKTQRPAKTLFHKEGLELWNEFKAYVKMLCVMVTISEIHSDIFGLHLIGFV